MDVLYNEPTSSARDERVPVADGVFDESDNPRYIEMHANAAVIDGTINILGHFFSTGVAFLVVIVLAASTGWMLVLTILFELTSFLDLIQIRVISVAFSSLRFLVPLYITKWAMDAEGEFNETTRSFASAMQLAHGMALNCKVVGFATESSLSPAAVDVRWGLLNRLFQLTKLLHYLNYTVYVSGHDELALVESGADLGVLSQELQRELRDSFGGGPVDVVNEIATAIESDALWALREHVVTHEEYKILTHHLPRIRAQASGMAAGRLAPKNAMIQIAKMTVIGVYLGFVLSIDIYNELGRYATLFYATQMPLLLGPMLIPRWLGDARQNSKRFKDEDHIAMRNRVMAKINVLQERVRRRLLA